MTEIDYLLGRSLSRERRRAGMSRMDVGRRVHISEATLAAFEEGRRRASAKQLLELAECYGVPVEGLFDWVERPVVSRGEGMTSMGPETDALRAHYEALSQSHRAAIYAFLLALGRD